MKWIMLLSSKFYIPPPFSVFSDTQNRGVFSAEQDSTKHKGGFSGEDRPAFTLSLSLMCASWETKWVESHRSDSVKLYLISPALRDLGRGRNKGGGGSGNEAEGLFGGLL